MKLFDFLGKSADWIFSYVSSTDGYRRWLREEKRRIASSMRVSILKVSSPEFVRLKEQEFQRSQGLMRAMILMQFEIVLPSCESMYLIEWSGEKTPKKALLPEGLVDLYKGCVYSEEGRKNIGQYYILSGSNENDQDSMLVYINPTRQTIGS